MSKLERETNYMAFNGTQVYLVNTVEIFFEAYKRANQSRKRIAYASWRRDL